MRIAPMQAPVGDSMFGRITNFLGADVFGSGAAASPGAAAAAAFMAGTPPPGFEKARPLLAQQVAIINRDQISESLLTGVKVSVNADGD